MYSHRHSLEWSTYLELVALCANHQNKTIKGLIQFAKKLANQGRDVMDLLWRIWNRPHGMDNTICDNEANNTKLLPELSIPLNRSDQDADSTETFDNHGAFARSCLRLIHCAGTLEDLLDCMRRRTQPHVSSNFDLVEREELMILVSKMFSELDPDHVEDSTSQRIHQTLDDMAAQARRGAGLGVHSSATSATLPQIVDALHTVMFAESNADNDNDAHRPFLGNSSDYYNYNNSLLHSVLRDKRGLPLTLALIYQFVGRRLGVQADIIGLPGHVVVYLPELDRFVDVFHRGQVLTRAECTSYIEHFGFHVRASFFEPMETDQVLHRVLNNLSNAFQQVNSCKLQNFCVKVMYDITTRPSFSELEDGRNAIAVAWAADQASGTPR